MRDHSLLTFNHPSFRKGFETRPNFIVSFNNGQVVQFWDYQNQEDVKNHCEDYYLKSGKMTKYKIYRNPWGTEFRI